MRQKILKKMIATSAGATFAYAAWLILNRWKQVRLSHIIPSYTTGGSPVKIGMICDQMTLDDFSQECSVIPITPWNWRAVLTEHPPDFLLCESAWQGPVKFENCWRGQIYRNHKVRFENRRVLLSILDACRDNNIPTVFWNKEDPVFWGDQQHDFVDTALRFDFIFTTAEECISRYQALGHSQVHLLQFGFSPQLFNPVGTGKMRQEAFFAGSWYQDRPERCQDQEALFDYVEKQKIPYTIFDRNSGLQGTENTFPQKYREHVRPAVPFAELSQLSKQYLYALNINTVKDSSTMFARRVYEMMAENHIIISNRSKGMEQEFPGTVWYCDQIEFPKDIPGMRRRNLEHVFRYHTWEKRLDTILDVLHLGEKRRKIRICIFSPDEIQPHKNGKSRLQDFEVEYRTWNGELEQLRKKELPLSGAAYAAFIRAGEPEPPNDWDFLLAQFSYLPLDCGVRWGKSTYEIVCDAENWNCIFPVRLVGDNLEGFYNKLKKIEI